jgi:hypothetical protein
VGKQQGCSLGFSLASGAGGAARAAPFMEISRGDDYSLKVSN